MKLYAREFNGQYEVIASYYTSLTRCGENLCYTRSDQDQPGNCHTVQQASPQAYGGEDEDERPHQEGEDRSLSWVDAVVHAQGGDVRLNRRDNPLWWRGGNRFVFLLIADCRLRSRRRWREVATVSSLGHWHRQLDKGLKDD